MCFSQWHNPIKIQIVFYKVYTTKNNTSTMVSSSSWPSEYIRIESKHQRTSYVLLYILAKHADNQGKSNEFSIWWPEWYTYTKFKEEILYNQCILISPNACPYINKYIQWATYLQFTPSPNKKRGKYPSSSTIKFQINRSI